MGSNIKKKNKPSSSGSSSSASFSLFGFLKLRRAQKEGVQDTEAMSSLKSKVWTSDYDRGRYVAEPGINGKASAFIKKFHDNCDSPIAV